MRPSPVVLRRHVRYWHLADIDLCTAQCPLSGVKRTWASALQMSAFDPKRTWSLATWPLPTHTSHAAPNRCSVLGADLAALICITIETCRFGARNNRARPVQHGGDELPPRPLRALRLPDHRELCGCVAPCSPLPQAQGHKTLASNRARADNVSPRSAPHAAHPARPTRGAPQRAANSAAVGGGSMTLEVLQAGQP